MKPRCGPRSRRPNSTPFWRAFPGPRSKPAEGKFDFSVLDGVIQGARAQKLRLVLLWFGTWKNGLSQLPAQLGEE